jgi:copper(I)-binding protein
MTRRLLAVLGGLAVLALPTVVLAQPAAPPAAVAGPAAYAPFHPLVGKSWRGAATAQPGVEDIQRWDWAVGGHAVRVVHSVNGGEYAGETLIFRDKDSGDYVFHYFTTGGFHTTGTMKATGPAAFDVDETVHGAAGIERLRSTAALGADGVYRVRSSAEQGGRWVEVGGFDYREDPSATPVLPAMAEPAAPQAAQEAAAAIGPLDLTRRLVVGVEQPGEDVAGYLRVRNGSAAADQLIGASCACAARIEFHQIRRSADRVSMDTDATWDVPGDGALEVRPGSALHLMLIGFDPAKAVDGKVSLTLNFRDAGQVTADFKVVEDSRAAWAGFD